MSGLSGIWFEGDNGNQCNFIGLDCGSCGTRGVAGDNHGLRDDSFLGNMFWGYHGATNTTNGPAYTTTNATYVQPQPYSGGEYTAVRTVTLPVVSSAPFISGQMLLIPAAGFYKVVTDIDPLKVKPDATSVNVNLIQALGLAVPGYVVSSGLSIVPPALSAQVSNVNARSGFFGCYTENSDFVVVSVLSTITVSPVGLYQVTAQFGGDATTDEVMQFRSAISASLGYTFRWYQAGLAWEMVWNKDTSYRAYYLSDGAAARGVGFFGSARFLLGRATYRLECFSNNAGGAGAKAPTTTSAADLFIAADSAIIGDTKGPFFERVTGVAGSNLTWTVQGQNPWNDAPVTLGDNDATLQPVTDGYRFRAAATLYTAARNDTLGTTNVKNGTLVLFERNDTSRFILTVTNGGAGGGTFTLPGGRRSWLQLRFDGTNWVFAGSAYFASVELRNQNLGFTNPLLTLSAEAKTVAMTGVELGDNIVWNARETSPAFPDGVIVRVRVSAVNQIEVRLFNSTGASVDPSGITWDFKVAS